MLQYSELFLEHSSCSKYVEAVLPSIFAEPHITNATSQTNMYAVEESSFKQFSNSSNENLDSSVEVTYSIISEGIK